MADSAGSVRSGLRIRWLTAPSARPGRTSATAAVAERCVAVATGGTDVLVICMPPGELSRVSMQPKTDH